MVEMVQKAIRFRASAEVHAAAASLTSAGIDINKLVSECILNEAKPKPEIYTYAKAVGLRVHGPFELYDQDALAVVVITNGSGAQWIPPHEVAAIHDIREATDVLRHRGFKVADPPPGDPRVRLVFKILGQARLAIVVSGAVCKTGQERCDLHPVVVPFGMTGADLIAFAEAHVRSHDPHYAVQRSA